MMTITFKTATLVAIGSWLALAVLGNVSAQEPSILVNDPALLPQEPKPQEPVPGTTEGALPAPAQQSEDVDLLMRAPLHEAFAEIPQTTPTPNPIVARKPPTDIEEMPPEYKPEGDNVLWIPGYWAWDEERTDFIWISGVWRDTPPGQRWVPGYWHEENNGFRYVNGFWAPEETQELTYLPQPPAPIDVGPSMQAPSEDYYYVPGCWVYRDFRYVWRPGYYAPYVEDIVWVPPTYLWTPGGYVFRAGYWDRPFDQRGTVFAPVFFRQPIYAVPNYFYRPTCIINTGYGLLPHLFIRNNCRNYYFGDWYADRYVGLGFCAWSSIGHRGFYQNTFDPLYCYYSSPFARYQNTTLIGWAQTQHLHCARNVNFRPPATFNLNIFIQKNEVNNVYAADAHDRVPDKQVYLANTLEREVKRASREQAKAKTFVRLDEQSREQSRGSAQPVKNLARERREQEKQVLKAAGPATENLNRSPQVVKLPKDVRDAQNDAEREKRSAALAAKRAEINKVIETRQQEAAAKAQARRSEIAQRKAENDAGRNSGSPAPNNRSAKNGANADSLAKKSPLPNQPVLRQQDDLSKREQVQQNQQQREQARAAEKGQAEQARVLRQQELQQRLSQQNAQRETERAARQQQELLQNQARQQQSQQAEMERAARRQQEQQASQQRQFEMQQRRANDEAQRRAADMQRAAERQRVDQDRMQRQMEQQRQRDFDRQQRDSERQQRNQNEGSRRKKN